MLAFFAMASPSFAAGNGTGNGTGLDLLSLVTSTSAFNNFPAEKIPKALTDTMVTSISTAQKSSVSIGNTIMLYTRNVFFSILGMVIVANITFMGFRIMLRASVVESLTQFTVSSFILAVVAGLTATQTPAIIIEKAMYELSAAGRKVGVEIIKNGLRGANSTRTLDQEAVVLTFVTGTSSSGNSTDLVSADTAPGEPACYWLAWIGIKNQQQITANATAADVSKDSQDNGKNGGEAGKEYKFSVASLMSRFFSDPQWSKAFKVDENKWTKPVPNTWQASAAGMMVATAPFRALSMCITIATIQTGAILQPVMQQTGVFSGALLAFYVVVSLGVATLPLIYFNTFRSLWSTYLTVITGISLIPCFYYVFSAIGFVFAANIFEALFPLAVESTASTTVAANPSFAMTLNMVFMRIAAICLANVSSALASFLQDTGLETLIAMIFGVTLALGRITFASGLVASIVTSGVSFALLGGQVAYKWAQGFGAEGLTDRVGELFSGIQSATGSGLSAMYGSAVNSASQGAGGIMSRLTGSKR